MYKPRFKKRIRSMRLGRLFHLQSFLLLLCALTAAQSASAQGGATISVQPEVVSESLSRGETWESEVTIVNGSDAPLPIHLSLVRWDALDETGGVTFIEQQEDASFDATQWFALSETDFILGPFEARIIPYTVSVPLNAEPGGKYVSLWVDPRIPDIYFGDMPVRIIPRITALFLLDIPVIGLDEAALAAHVNVSEFSVKDRAPLLSGAASRIASLFRAPSTTFAQEPGVSIDVLDTKPDSLLLRVENTGITHIRPSARLVVRNGFGAEVLDTNVDATTILPGKVRELPVEFTATDIPLLPRALERQLAFGRYSASAVVDVPGADPLLTSLTYWVFPWQSLLLTLFIIGGGGVVGFRFRQRIGVALKVLFLGKNASKST